METNSRKMPLYAYGRKNPKAPSPTKKHYPSICELFGHRFNLRDYSRHGKVFSVCTQCDHEQPITP